MPVGVLNGEQIRKLVVEQSILKSDSDIDCSRISPEDSAIDAPLGDVMYVMKGSRRPADTEAVLDVIKHYKDGDKISLTPGTTLERGKVYLIKLAWDVALPRGMCIRATAKSSIGRLDALVRLVADKEAEFDRVSAEKSASLYVEVAPLTFPLHVQPRLALSQLRFMLGDEEWCTVPHEALRPPFEAPPVLILPAGSEPKMQQGDPAGVLLSLNLDPDEASGFVGYCAKQDVTAPIDPDKKDSYPANDFWEPVCSDGERSITIKRDRFYIFRSVERFCVPGHLSVDCQAYSDGLGDIRIHYAGFAHPFFGKGHPKGGAPLIFEVRGHSVDTILRHGDALAKVYFRRMSEIAPEPSSLSSYSGQELTLSKCFKPWKA